MVQRAQRAQSVQAVSSLSADVSSLLIASCPHHITQSEIGSHTLTRLQPSPMSENRNANALPQAFPFVTIVGHETCLWLHGIELPAYPQKNFFHG